MAEDEIVSLHHQLNANEFEQTPGPSGGKKSLMYSSPWGCTESDMSWQLNNINKNSK